MLGVGLVAMLPFYGTNLQVITFRGDVPNGFSAHNPNFANRRTPLFISFPMEYATEWEQALEGGYLTRSTTRDAVIQAHIDKTEIHIEYLTPKKIKVTYAVTSDLPTVKVRAVAWKDGVRSFANIVPVRTGEGVPHGESVTTNEEHTFVWDVASDWATDLDKVSVEILVQEGALLPQERIVIPATETHKAMTITRNVLAQTWLFDALVWCYSEGDGRLTINDGRALVDGTEVARERSLPSDHYWLQSLGGPWSDAGWTKKATALLNYLYGKMGYKVLAGEDLDYAERATRLDFADDVNSLESKALQQVSVKIEEE